MTDNGARSLERQAGATPRRGMACDSNGSPSRPLAGSAGACLRIVLLLLFAAGCASTTQVVPYSDPRQNVQDPENARICVAQRPWLVINIASHTTPMAIYDGGTFIGTLVGRGHLCWERQPGITKLSAASSTAPPWRSSAYRSDRFEFTAEKGPSLLRAAAAPSGLYDVVSGGWGIYGHI